jgi:hypothetical protein
MNRRPLFLVCSALVGVVAGVACDRTGQDLTAIPNPDYPAILELGVVDVLTEAEWAAVRAGASADVEAYVAYEQVGASEPGTHGGVTFSFLGTGDEVCVLVDPESVLWMQSVAASGTNAVYEYPDNYQDDGDLDIYAGLSATYAGSPGVELGDFTGFYTDSLGNVTAIEYNLCQTVGSDGESFVHAGKGSPEWCTIDTAEREGIEYTVVLRTFSLPIDDDILSFGLVVFEGDCSNLDECSIPGESRSDEDASREGEFRALEQAYCDNEQSEYCEANPDMCGDY